MNHRNAVIALLVSVALVKTATAVPLGTSVTYQGRLKNAGQPANGSFNLIFTLWDAAGTGNPPVGGVQIGNADNKPNTLVTDGLFTVQLNSTNQFGTNAFNGQARWLQVSVNGTVLGPRQPLTAAPYAHYAVTAAGAPLILPFSGSFAGSDQTALSIIQTGLGYAANFTSSDSGNYYGALGVGAVGQGASLFVTNSGTGSCARLQNVSQANDAFPTVHATTFGAAPALRGDSALGTNGTGVYGLARGTGHGVRALAEGSGNALQAITDGTGRAAFFQSTNPANALSTVRIDTNSTNTGVNTLAALNTGMGRAGLFQLTNPDNTSIALYALTSGTGPGLRVRSEEGSVYKEINVSGTSINSASNAVPFGSPLALNDSSGSNMSLCFGGGNVGVGTAGGVLVAAKLQVDGGGDVSPSQNGNHFTLGSVAGINLGFDNNEIMARNNGATSPLFLNHNGGDIHLIQNGTGAVGIGTPTIPAGVKLAVDGKVLCEELEIQLSQDWPDYVFESEYDLMPLSEVSEFIRREKHLPGIPSAAEIREKGLALGQMQVDVVRKIEELTLHMIDLDRQVKSLQQENAALRAKFGAE